MKEKYFNSQETSYHFGPILRSVAVLFVLGCLSFFCATPICAKVNLTPYIVFDGKKGKDKLPSGEGRLYFYQAKGVNCQGWISGRFDGANIYDASIKDLFNINNNNIEGNLSYSLTYDKKSGITDLDLTIVDGRINRIPVQNITINIYKVKNNDYVLSTDSITKEIHYIDSNVLTEFPRDWKFENTKFTITNYSISIHTHTIGWARYNELKLDPLYIKTSDGIIVKKDDKREYGLIVYTDKSVVSPIRGGSYTSDRLSFDICLKDNGHISSEGKSDSIIINYPNKNVYIGTINNIDFSRYLDMEEYSAFYSRKPIDLTGDDAVNFLREMESYSSADFEYKSGILTTSTGEQTEYYNGVSMKEFGTSEPKIIKVKEAGSILSVISPEELKTITDLRIVGTLNENDLSIINRVATNLIRLDLRLAYTKLSDEKTAEREAQSQALAALFGLMGTMADAKYNNFEMNTADYASVKAFTDIVSEATSKTKNSYANCVIPENAFYGNSRIREIYLPIWCSTIERAAFYHCSNLKTVQLPPYLKNISGQAFAFCTHLEDMNFPATLTNIAPHHGGVDWGGEGAFEGCTSLRHVDLSKTTSDSYYATQWGGGFWGCTLETIKLPKGVSRFIFSINAKTIYVQKGLERFSCHDNTTIYFSDKVAPYADPKPRNCTLYVPKGAMTNYYAKFGEYNNKIIEY